MHITQHSKLEQGKTLAQAHVVIIGSLMTLFYQERMVLTSHRGLLVGHLVLMS